jgi:RNA polymerase sigma factor (sigma-70 family)
MATSQMRACVERLRSAALLRDGGGLTDGQLLELYIRRREEAAFAALVRRHGPMVWGVCRRLLRKHHDAEDAFQATFLVLVRRRATIVPRDMLANWLYGVARQTALKARSTAATRTRRERHVTKMPQPAAAEPKRPPDWHDLLDDALSRLPDKYRGVVILCDLEGKSRKEAARQLGCPEGTVAGRLARARTMLAKWLARRGLAMSGGALAAALLENAARAAVPTPLFSLTIRAAGAFAAGQTAAVGMISARVVALTEGVLKTMSLTKLKVATAAIFLCAALCGAGLLASPAQEQKTDATSPKQVKEDGDKLKDTLLALDKELWDAAAKGDVDALKKILAEDYLSIWAVDDRTDKAAALETAKRYRYSDRTTRDVEARPIGKNAAVLTYVCSYKVSVDNEEPRALPDRRVSTVWAKREDRWVVVFAQAMSRGD